MLYWPRSSLAMLIEYSLEIGISANEESRASGFTRERFQSVGSLSRLCAIYNVRNGVNDGIR